MDLIGRMLSLAVGAFLLGLALLVGFWAFLILFSVAVALGIFFWVRAYLLEKEILNPQPGVHIEQIETHETVIEGDYEKLNEDKR